MAVEELELTVSRLERTSAVIPHIQSLIDFLASLFTDGHMKVSIGSLEVSTCGGLHALLLCCVRTFSRSSNISFATYALCR